MQRKKGSILLYQTFAFLMVEATGLEGVPKSLNPFIYKGLRVFTPRRSPKSFIHFPNVINAYKKQKREAARFSFLLSYIINSAWSTTREIASSVKSGG